MNGRHDRTLWYLSLELPIEGQASHTHIFAILAGLMSRGWSTRLFHPRQRGGRRGVWRRLIDMAVAEGRLATHPGRPSLLYVRGHFAALPAVMWARSRGIPVVLEINGPTTDVLSSWPLARFVLPALEISGRMQLRLASCVIAVTPELAEAALSRGAHRAHVVTNGADTHLFEERAETTAHLPERFVCFFGTLATWQGIDTLLEAVDRPQWPADVSLVIMGDGVLAELVKGRAGVDPRVVHLGRLPHRAVAGVVSKSVAAVSPKSATDHARSGVLPLKLFEAMACGVPVIVTDLPGQADIVTRHTCGVVVPPRDPDAVASAVARLAGDPAIAGSMGRLGRRAVLDHYSWDAASAKTDAILRSVLDG